MNDELNGFEVVDDESAAPPDDVAMLDRLVDTLSAKEGRPEFLGNLLKLGDLKKEVANDLLSVATFRDSIAANKAVLDKLSERDGQIGELSQSQQAIVDGMARMVSRADVQSAMMQAIVDAQRQQGETVVQALNAIVATLGDYGRTNGEMQAALKTLSKSLTPSKPKPYKPAKFKITRDLANFATEIEELP